MPIPLNQIVDVNVEVSSTISAVLSDFSLGLIIGKSTVISTADRVKTYSSLAEMLADGFATTDEEYLAAQKYFSQVPTPASVAIGRMGAAPETEVQAITACRAANENWYGACFAESVADADIPGVAAAVEAFEIPSFYIAVTSTAAVLTATTPNVMDTLKNSSYKRTIGFYSAKDYFAPAVLGRISGFNSGEPNSAYTLAYKTLVGIEPDALTSSQLGYLKGYNGNAYTKFIKGYNFIVQGTMASGLHVDELYFQDLASNYIQADIIASLVSSKVIPQTEDGVTQIISAISGACNSIAAIGFISTGIWTGSKVLNIEPGDVIPGGFAIQSVPIAEQSAADRAARKAPTIYVCLKSSGAVENLVINVMINQ